MRIIVHRTYSIEFDGTQDQYIDLAEQMQGLDSHDAGDATGAYLDVANRVGEPPGVMVLTNPLALAAITFEDDSFIYEGQWGSEHSPIGYEARCKKCGETFNPADENDLEHGIREDGVECGGAGMMVGSWG